MAYQTLDELAEDYADEVGARQRVHVLAFKEALGIAFAWGQRTDLSRSTSVPGEAAMIGVPTATQPNVRRQTILNTIDDLVTNFLYYGRKESASLPLGAIEDAVRAGEITIDDMVHLFRNRLSAGLIGSAVDGETAP